MRNKETKTQETKYKRQARSSGTRRRKLESLVHELPTRRQSTVKTRNSIAAILRVHIWSQESQQALIQPFENLTPKVFKELDL